MRRSERTLVAVAAAITLALLLTLLVVGWRTGDDGGGGLTAGSGPASPSVPAARSLPPSDASGSPPASSTTSDGADDDHDGGDGDGNGDDEDGEDEDRDPVNEVGVEVGAVAGTDGLPAVEEVTCPRDGVRVATADQLTEALAEAERGTAILLEDGRYEGAFVATASGTQDEPVWLCGGRDAVLDGGGVTKGYVLHLDGADHWRLVGFSVQNGQKGVMADGTVGSVVQGLAVEQIGDEAIHLRGHSTDNLVIGNQVSRTGLRRDKFGEGVYIGSAVSNWCTITDCLPDRSDRNVVAHNVFLHTTSEAIDVKEGTVGGLLLGNTFDGAATTAADSWVDVKGTAWLVEGNRGTSTPLDGFQTHQILDRWGERNVFRRNVIESGPTRDEDGDPGHGIALRPEAGNVVRCDNTVTGGITLSNVPCT